MVAGLGGVGFTGSYIFSQTVFSQKNGVDSRLNGWVVAGVESLMFLLPFSIVQVGRRVGGRGGVHGHRRVFDGVGLRGAGIEFGGGDRSPDFISAASPLFGLDRPTLMPSSTRGSLTSFSLIPLPFLPVQYIPNFFQGSLLLWFGIEIAWDWLLLSYSKMTLMVGLGCEWWWRWWWQLWACVWPSGVRQLPPLRT